MTVSLCQSIFPALRYVDAWGAIDFLEKAFGFSRHAVFEGPSHSVGHAELRLGTASIGLNSAGPAVADNPWTQVRCGVYAVLADAAAVDAHHARALAAGARIARPLQDTSYGSRDYAAWDLDGHLWGFGTYSYAVPGEPDLFVNLRYRDGRAAVDWLARAFGLGRGIDVPGPDDTLAHAELSLGDSVLMVSGGDDVAWAGERQATCIHVADPDAHHARAVRGGATIVMSPADTTYGARAYVARDPEGFFWTFSTYRPAQATRGAS
jgi:uncharacterized glyoxalase superfamily protein PhnB